MASLVPFLSETVNLIPATSAASDTKKALICGQRYTDGELLPTINGVTHPNYYEPFELPSFPNGFAALNYLKQFGIQSQRGINFSLVLPAPNTLVTSNGLTTITWSTIPSGFSQLTGFALSGTTSQATPGVVNGTIYLAEIVSGVATMVFYGTVPFVLAGASGGNLTITGVNNVNYPDPESDPIALLVWDFYQTASSAAPSIDGTPSALISLLSDRDTSINPSSTPIVLGNPTVVVNNPDGSSDLTFPTSTDGLGYLPTSSLGASQVTQVVSLPTNSTNSVYFAAGKFLQGGAGAGIQYSTDGLTWIATNKTTGTVNDFHHNGTAFVAATTVGIYQSVDGISWTVTNKSTGSFNKVYYNEGLWIGLSTVGIWYSPDLDGSAGWVVSTGAATGVFNQAAYANGGWIATSTVDCYASADGITWAALSVASAAFDGIAYANGVWQLGSGGTSGILYSVNGTTFSASNITSGAYHKFLYADSIWVAIGTNVQNSASGVSWATSTGTGASQSYATGDVIFTEEQFIFASAVGLYYSANGIALTTSNTATGSYKSIATDSDSTVVTGGTSGLKTAILPADWSTSGTASGVYNGFEVSGNNVIINVQTSSDDFVTSSVVSVILDNTANVGNYLANIDLYGAVLQFPVATSNDITVTQSAFFDMIETLNEASQVMERHFLTYGMAGNITVLPTSASSLPSPNTMNNILVTYPYEYKFGNIPYENAAGNVAGGRVTAAVAYLLANGDAPYPSLALSTIAHLPVSKVYKTTSYSAKPGGTGAIAIGQGWLPLAPNTSGVVALIQSVTTLITIPGTNIPDTSFRSTHISDCIRDLKRAVADSFEILRKLPNNAGIALLSDTFLKQFRSNILGILAIAENVKLIENLSLYQNEVSVIINPTNPNGIIAYIPSQIINPVNGADIVFNIFEANVTNFITGAQ